MIVSKVSGSYCKGAVRSGTDHALGQTSLSARLDVLTCFVCVVSMCFFVVLGCCNPTTPSRAGVLTRSPGSGDSNKDRLALQSETLCT